MTLLPLLQVCYTDAIGQAPALRLDCGHAFHFACIESLLKARWNGPRITFGFRNCPLCKGTPAKHPMLAPLTDPIDALEDTVRRKALLRLQVRWRVGERAPSVG
jgi:RCR-type E3 ubiquitin transferase